jgi:hypothetical protein
MTVRAKDHDVLRPFFPVSIRHMVYLKRHRLIGEDADACGSVAKSAASFATVLSASPCPCADLPPVLRVQVVVPVPVAARSERLNGYSTLVAHPRIVIRYRMRRR